MTRPRWHFAAVFGEFDHDLLVQPNVHRRRIFRAPGVVELGGKLLARGEAAVELEKLPQIDDRLSPIEILGGGFGEFVHDRGDVQLRGR